MRVNIYTLVLFCFLMPMGATANPMFTPKTDVSFPETLAVTYHQMVSMRDNIDLATDIYLPASKGKFPVLLVRDIYGNGAQASRQRYAKFATQNGYAFVYQIARGRYDSEGNWYPYFQEINDGDDTLTWIAKQPWSNGNVGMFGTSYLASVQWLAALNRNPVLKAIAPAMSPGNYYRDVAYPGGAFSLLSRASWGIGTVGSRTNGAFPIDWIGGIEHLPIKTLDQSLGFDVRHFRDWLDHPTYDAYWEPLNLEARADEMTVPALNIGGWFDVFLRSTIGSYRTMGANAAAAIARENQRMIIGPWPHGWNATTKTGELDFGKKALINEEALMLEWFDHFLKGKPLPDRAPVMLFVMGKNEWREEHEWPLARTLYTAYYLHADGSLKTAAPAATGGKVRYVYDPKDPVPTLGGNIMRPELRGPFYQAPLDNREDIIRFTTEAFATTTEITGPIGVQLYAESDATDTDFMAKLVVIKQDGRAFNLVDGVIRARYRNSFSEPALLEPGKVYLYDIDLWATSYQLDPGDRLRIDITSSNFPRLNRNPNTGAPFGETTRMIRARQAIHASREYPSHVVLPIIPATGQAMR